MDRLMDYARTAQTFLPWAADAKATVQRRIRLWSRRPFEADFRALVDLGIQPGDICIDIGGNRGQSIDAIRMVVPGAQVISFEPNARLAARLQRMFCGDDVAVRQLALGVVAGEFELHTPSYRGFVFDGLASLTEGEARGWLEKRIVRFDPLKLSVHGEICSVSTIDAELIETPMRFIKLDIQGFELQALRGGMETIKRHRPTILVESPGEEIRALMAALDYEPWTYKDGALVAGPLPALNTFFLRGPPSGR